MEKLQQLKDLLRHEIKDLQSAEEQIFKAMPAMIEKISDSKLKQVLSDHREETATQLERLQKALALLGPETEQAKTGLFARLFSGSEKCKGMEGLIREGEKMLSPDIDPDVRDAAIIGCAQKIEHYEISGYGTAKAYAQELRLNKIVLLLKATLQEEYQADRVLTELAVDRLNKEAVSRRKTTSVKAANTAKVRSKKNPSKKSAPKKMAKKPAKPRTTKKAA